MVRSDVEDGQGESSDSTQWQMSIGHVVRLDVEDGQGKVVIVHGGR